MRILMIQGCTSDAGKSTIVTGLCRLLQRRGLSVVPFKPQNMALNSAVTIDGGEIGRAQAVQAQACGLPPHSDMNPVLLKPNAGARAQVIIHGKAVTHMSAADYHHYKTTAMRAVLQSCERLSQQYEIMIVEGAGSPAEVNLRKGDIANMGFAEAIECPVILVGDIDRGGVFAHLVGTLELLTPSERDRVKGFIINRFRGDISLLQSGLDWLEQKTGKPVFGVLNYLHNLHLEAEDAIKTEQTSGDGHKINIVVPKFPRISNHTDFDVLRLHPQVNLQFLSLGEMPPTQKFPPCDLIILPGSKSVRADFALLEQNGWRDIIEKHLRYGGKLMGICGGLQMLGRSIQDPYGIEGDAGSSNALGLLDFVTTLEKEKQLHRVSGTLTLDQASVSGYEIHCGISSGPAMQHPLVCLGQRSDGVLSADQKILGTYLHGIFDDSHARESLLRWAGLKSVAPLDYPALLEREIDRLADEMANSLDIDQILALDSVSENQPTANSN